MSHYPIILIPPQIQRVKSKLPPTEVFNEPQPQLTGEEPKKVNKTVIAVEAAAVTIPSVVIGNQGATLPGLLLFLMGTGAIATQAWRQVKTYRKRKQKYRRQVAVYRESLEEYDRKKTLHEEEQKASQSPEGVAAFQYKFLLDILIRTVPYDGVESKAPIGASEAKFKTYLDQYFPGLIQTQLKVQNPAYSQGFHYTPDFAYIDEELNLHIDIEIDEPYAYRSGKPTHYIGKDKKRNQEFCDRGWIVIRFSEKQIICNPDSCCKTIAATISEITGDGSIISQFSSVPDLDPQPQWTDSEALEMACNRVRNKYVCLSRKR